MYPQPRMFRPHRLALLALLLIPGAGLAQTAKQRPLPPPSNAPPATGKATEASPGLTKNLPSQEQGTLSTSEIKDPMLTPVAPPKRVLKDWAEARTFILARSVDLRIAEREVDKAAAQARTALASVLPTINGSVNYTEQLVTKSGVQISGFDPATLAPSFRYFQTPQTGIVNAGVNLSWVPISINSWRVTETARQGIAASELAVNDAKRTIALNLASAIVSVFTAERVAELNRVGLRAAMERRDIARRKQELGNATALDVVRADQDVAAARATLVSGDEALRQSREALGLGLGVAEQVGVTPTLKLDTMASDGSLGACKPIGVEDRTDVVVAKARVDVAKRSPTDILTETIPTIGVQSAASATSADTGISPNATWSVQAILSVPIWDGGARYGRLRTARANLDQAQARYEGTQRTAAIQTIQAVRSVEVAEKNREVAEETRKLAYETDRLTRAAYAEGLGTSLELVTAASSLRQADVNLALRDFELVRARILAFLSTQDCVW